MKKLFTTALLIISLVCTLVFIYFHIAALFEYHNFFTEIVEPAHILIMIICIPIIIYSHMVTKNLKFKEGFKIVSWKIRLIPILAFANFAYWLFYTGHKYPSSLEGDLAAIVAGKVFTSGWLVLILYTLSSIYLAYVYIQKKHSS